MEIHGFLMGFSRKNFELQPFTFLIIYNNIIIIDYIGELRYSTALAGLWIAKQAKLSYGPLNYDLDVTVVQGSCCGTIFGVSSNFILLKAQAL